jgi:hypothetical protein
MPHLSRFIQGFFDPCQTLYTQDSRVADTLIAYVTEDVLFQWPIGCTVREPVSGLKIATYTKNLSFDVSWLSHSRALSPPGRYG